MGSAKLPLSDLQGIRPGCLVLFNPKLPYIKAVFLFFIYLFLKPVNL